jgi:hypothetical protein
MSLLRKYFVPLFIFLLISLLTACTAGPTPAQSGGNEPTMEAGEVMEHGEQEHDDQTGHEHEHDEGEEAKRVPNNGAVVKIVSPENGGEIKVGTDIVVEIETENFALGEEGNHWHVSVDGQSQGMVMGQDYNEVVRGLEPGEHEISVMLSIGTHEELEEGDAIGITVVE